MFSVRELAELVRRLDQPTFSRQMGPFALMQRPRQEKTRAQFAEAMRISNVVRMRAPPAMVDFGDLIIATLPPPSPDGSMQLIVGCAPDCDLVVHDESISTHHARVLWDGASATIEELGSENGTFINNLKMKDRWTLRDGDHVSFGQAHFLFLWAASLHTRLRALAR